MGQYYEVLAEDKDGKRTVYDRSVDGNYTMAKLMEHSWWNNSFCRAISETLVDNPRKIAWVGDYAEEDECKELGFEYVEVWGREDQDPAVGISSTDFMLDRVKYLVNVTKKLYVDLAKYRESSMEEDGCTIHPIPVLTCIGNGRGGGDYCPADGVSDEWIGAWAFDAIMLTNDKPDGCVEICPVFREN